MKNLLSVLTKLFCRHDWKRTNSKVIGAALGWDFRATRGFSINFECKKCGKRKEEQVFVNLDDKKYNSECYDKDGWPIDPVSGKELKLVDR